MEEKQMKLGNESGGAQASGEKLARTIDHTLLKPGATLAAIQQLCAEALQYKFATVCVNPYWVAEAAAALEGSEVGVTTVIGFPLGASATAVKVFEARQALADGATEIDMVVNLDALKSGRLEVVQADIQAVADVCKDRAPLKVILETGVLTEEEKREACHICIAAGADFVKTSTGFGPGGATVEDIRLLRELVGPSKGVKASGGIRDTETALAMLEAGASRIGASAGIAIVSGSHKSGASGY